MDVRYIFLTYVIVKMVLSKTFAFVHATTLIYVISYHFQEPQNLVLEDFA